MIVSHAHALQWLKEKESCPAAFHIVSGAGAKTKNFVTKINFNESYWQQDEFRGTAYTRTMLRNSRL